MAESSKLVIDASQIVKTLDEVYQGSTKAASGLDVLDAQLRETSATFKTVSDAAKRAGAETNNAFKLGSAKGVADAVNDLQREFDELKRSADTLKTALKGATDPTAVKLYAGSIAQLELGMADLERTGKAAGVNLRDNNKQAGLGKQVFNEFFGAFSKAFLIAEAIRLVVKFVTSAVNLAQETAKATRQFENFLGSTEAAAGAVADLTALSSKKLLNTQDVLDAGKGLLAFGEGVGNLVPVLDRIADISAATGKNFNELVTIYGKARTSGVLYAEDINQLVDAGIPIIQEFAKQMGVSNDQVKKLASEGKISFEELQLAFFNLTKEGAKFADASETQANELSGLWARLVSEVRPAIAAIGDFFKQAAEGFVSVALLAVREIKGLFGSVPGKVEQVIEAEYKGRDAYEQAKDDLYERERLEKAAAKRRLELAQKNGDDLAKIEKQRAALRVQVIADETQREVAAENLRFQTLQAELKKLFKGRAELNGLLEQAAKQHQQNLSKIYLDELESFRDAREEYEKIQEERLKKDAANKKERERILIEGAEAERDIRNASIDIGAERVNAYLLRLKEQGASEAEIKQAQAEFDLQVQAARLKSEIEFQQALLALTDTGDQKQIERIQKNIELLQAKLGNIQFQIDTPETQKTSIFSLLGLDPNSPDFERDKAALQQAAAEVVSSLQLIGQARLDAAQAATDAAERELDIAEEKTDRAREYLSEQQALQDEGFANNVKAAEDALAAAEQAEAQKKAARDKALADQAKAQRAQIILDTVLQSSNIISAASNIIKGFSVIPFVGGALGIAAAGVMIAGFLKAKISAIQAVNAQKFRHGGSGWISDDGFVSGKTHEQGGNLLEIEKGEVFQVGDDGGKRRVAVVRRERAKEYFSLLEAANKGDKAALAKHAWALSDFAVPTFPSFDSTNRIEIDRDAVAERVFNGREEKAVTVAVSDEELSQWRENNRLLSAMLTQMKKANERETWSADGKTRVRGNVRTRILN